MPRPKIPCVGGPWCGDWFYAPIGQQASLVVPASADLGIKWARILMAVGIPALNRRCVYRAEVQKPSGDIILRYLGE